jgi:hypothetical protein
MAKELKIKVGLDSAAFFAGLKSVQGAISGAGRTIGSVAARAAAALAAIGAPLTAGAFAMGIKNALDFGGAISDAAARTGIAADQLAVLQQAFIDGGLSADQAGQSINKMQRSIFEAGQAKTSSNASVEALRAIGLEVKDVIGLDPAAQFDKISRAIGATADPAARAAASMAIFGRSGAELQTLFRNPEALAKAAQRIGSQAGILGRQASRFDEVSDSFNAIGVKIRGFFIGIADKVLPQLEALAAWFDKLDLAPLGQRLGEQISSALNILVNGFRQNKLGDLATLGLKIAFGESVNYLGGLLLGVVDGLGNALGAAFRAIFSGETVRPMLQVFLAIPEIIIGGIISGMARVAGALKGVMAFVVQEFVNLLPAKLRSYLTGSESKGTRTLSESIADEQQGLAGTVASLGDALVNDALDRFGDAGARIGAQLVNLGKAFAAADFSAAQVIDTSGLKAELKALADSLNTPLAAVEQAATSAGQAFDDIGSSGAFRQPDVDQFARVGLFAGQGGVGAQSTRALDYARKTSEGIQRIRDTMAAGLKVTMAGAVEVRV